MSILKNYNFWYNYRYQARTGNAEWRGRATSKNETVPTLSNRVPERSEPTQYGC
jgi:hypothetical protein